MGRGALMIGVILVIGIAAATFAIRGAFDGTSDQIDDAVSLAGDVSGGDAAEGDSLYLAENLEPALGEVIERVGNDAVVQVKIEQRSVKLTAVPPGEDTVSVVVGAGGNAIETPIAGLEIDGPELGAIDPESVQQVAEEVASQAGVSLAEIDYFTTLSGRKVDTWGVYLDDGRRWESGIDGSNLRQAA